MPPKSFATLIRESRLPPPGPLGGPIIEAYKKVDGPPPYHPEPNSAPLGALTGAPPRTVVKSIMVLPGTEPTLIAEETRNSRIVQLTAPLVGFTIFVGDAGVNTMNGLSLPLGLAYDIPLPGFQPLYAVTDSPVLLRMNVVISSILVGDIERAYGRGP